MDEAKPELLGEDFNLEECVECEREFTPSDDSLLCAYCSKHFGQEAGGEG